LLYRGSHSKADPRVSVPTAKGLHMDTNETPEAQAERGRAATRERIARTGDPFLGAAAPADEEW
jgi:hypothetical protein